MNNYNNQSGINQILNEQVFIPNFNQNNMQNNMNKPPINNNFANNNQIPVHNQKIKEEVKNKFENNKNEIPKAVININNNNSMLNNNMLNNSIYNLKQIGKPIQNDPIPQVNAFNNNVNPNIGNMANANRLKFNQKRWAKTKNKS